LAIRRLRGVVVVGVPHPSAVPDWNVALTPATSFRDVQIAKLIRRRVADLLRGM
jgi:hypothetical protein